MAEQRNPCQTCSIKGAYNTISLPVLVGDGNCTYCIANRPKTDSVDEAYRYRVPTTHDHTPFNDRQYARLLSLRGRVLDKKLAKHTTDEDGL